MYRSLGNQGRFKSACHQITRGNFMLVVVLTITSTALTTYFLNSLTSSYRRLDKSNLAVTEISVDELASSSSIRAPTNSTESLSPLINHNDLDTAAGNQLQVWSQPIKEVASESRTKPDITQTLEHELAGFKQRLASMSKKDLVILLKMLQERVSKTALLIRKRNTVQQQPATTSSTPALPEMSNNNQSATEAEGVVIRSAKMNKLMSYLTKIESSMPDLDMEQLDRLSQMNKDKSSLRIVKPSVMDAIMQPNLGNQIRSWREPVESVAPEPGWPQEIEDWQAPSTSKPRNNKKKKKKKTSTTSAPSSTSSSTTAPTTTTTSTTTTTTPAPSTPSLPESSTAAPSSTPANTIEEVWIEEEEEIVRPPPKKRRKKYKKKTSPPPNNPVSSTTPAPTSSSTTSTTTTIAPTSSTTTAPTSTTSTTTTTTTTPEATTVEDWPEDQPESTTEAALWPPEEQGQDEKWPQEVPKEKWPQDNGKEKWPEEDWLDAVRDQVQNQFNIVYV